MFEIVSGPCSICLCSCSRSVLISQLLTMESFFKLASMTRQEIIDYDILDKSTASISFPFGLQNIIREKDHLQKAEDSR